MKNDTIKAIKLLEETSSTKDKISIIQDNRFNSEFLKLLKATYNDSQYGFSNKKLRESLENFTPTQDTTLASRLGITNIFELCSCLANNNINDTLRNLTYQYINSLRPVEREIAIRVLTKDLRCGISVKTINKALPNFIPTFSVMLAETYKPNKTKLQEDKFIITTKLDGIRCIIKIKNKQIKFFTRQGKLIEGLVEIQEDIQKVVDKGLDNLVLDGELLMDNKEELLSQDLFQETDKILKKKGEKRNIVFNAFDYLYASDFENDNDNTPCYLRKQRLQQLIDTFNFSHIVYVEPLYIGEDINQINYWLEEITSKGGEGVMINLYNKPYSCKRTSNLLKLKKVQEADVRVVKLIEGEKGSEGKLGAIVIQFEHENKLYTCRCGSGFNKEEIVKYWNNQELLLNKIVTIRYYGISQDSKTGLYALRLPRWIHRIREDKNEISMY